MSGVPRRGPLPSEMEAVFHQVSRRTVSGFIRFIVSHLLVPFLGEQATDRNGALRGQHLRLLHSG